MQSKFQKANHIYRIASDLNLNGITLRIPANCVLDFSDGGKITNGSIVLNGTYIQPNGCIVTRYISATISGTYGKGQCLFDENLLKPKWWNGEEWTDASGNGIS